MKIQCIGDYGLSQSLFGLGLSYGLTSGISSWAGVPEDVKERLRKVAGILCKKDGGENKFLRQIYYVWDITAPSYWWPQFDQYKVGTVTQSESKMHSLLKRPFTPEDFGGNDSAVEALNILREEWLAMEDETSRRELWQEILESLPMSYHQRRICSMNLAVMKNVYHQRKHHKLGEWHQVCQAFVDATPSFLQGIYDDADKG